jgi:creatinine amidohydrolase
MKTELLEENWTTLAQADMDKTVIFVGIAPVEEHGRHLPLGVDVYETERWMRDAAALLAEREPTLTCGILPVIPLGFANMGRFPGNVHVSRKLIYQVVYETISAVAGWGVKNILVISGHADPLHTIAVEQACDTLNRERGMTALAPMGAIFSAAEKGIKGEPHEELAHMEAQYPNDFHAGWVETSCMLDIRPELVGDCYRDRPDISLQGRELMDGGRVAAAIAGEGHIGFPRAASESLGRLLNEDSAEKICTAAERFAARQGYECYQHHPLYEIPALRLRLD